MSTRRAWIRIGTAAAVLASVWLSAALPPQRATGAQAPGPEAPAPERPRAADAPVEHALPPERPRAADAPAVRFEARDIYVGAGDERLAAYQLELIDRDRRTVVAGVEGGEHEAFRAPPYYDPEALAKGRLILAAFSTAADLPTGRTRVARVHLQIEGDGPPPLEVKLTLAADAEGRKFEATATLQETER